MNYKYNKLTPFKLLCLKSFPFIEADFDALTNYEIMCILKENMNKLNENNNILIKNIDSLNDWFNNLDVQEEVNNKLDEMAQSGQLTDIIAQYIQLAGVLVYQTVSEMKQATNYVNGSIARTLGQNSWNDEEGAYYRIRTITSSDVVDEYNIVSLTNFSTLIAERVPAKTSKRRVIIIGDSYGVQNNDGDITKFYYEYLRDSLGLVQNSTFYSNFRSGAGFGNSAFLANLQELENTISNKNNITDILVCGGWNDSDLSQSYGTDEMFNAGILAFNNYARQKYPNAKITIAHISWGDPNVSHNYSTIYNQLPTSIKRYKNACSIYGWAFLSGAEYILHQYDENIWQSDGNHPNQQGEKLLGEELTRAFISGSIDVHYLHGASITGSGNVEYVNINQIYSEVYRDVTRLWCAKTNVGIYFKINETVTPTMNCDGNHEYEMATIYSLEMIGHDLFVIDNIPIYITGSHDGQASSTYIGFADILVHDSKIYLRPTLFDGGQRQENINVNYIWIPNFNITAPTIYS